VNGSAATNIQLGVIHYLFGELMGLVWRKLRMASEAWICRLFKMV
jgi:hypothetical protein